MIPRLDDDDGIIAFALDIWGNYIETYSVSMSAEDMKNREWMMPAEDFVEPNFLTTKQKELVERIRYLSEEHKRKMESFGEDVMLCGHAHSDLVSSDEGTSYCGACAAVARETITSRQAKGRR